MCGCITTGTYYWSSCMITKPLCAVNSTAAGLACISPCQLPTIILHNTRDNNQVRTHGCDTKQRVAAHVDHHTMRYTCTKACQIICTTFFSYVFKHKHAQECLIMLYGTMGSIMMFPPSLNDPLVHMQATDLGATEEALVMFRYKVRRALRDQQGYECQEADGDFMLAFTTPADAVRFCLSVCLC